MEHKYLNRQETLERFIGMLAQQKSLQNLHTKETYRIYEGDTEYARKEYLLLGFEIWTTYYDDAGIGSFGQMVETEEDVKKLQGLINGFNIRVKYKNQNDLEGYIKFSQFAKANGFF